MCIFNISRWQTFLPEDGYVELHCSKCGHELKDEKHYKEIGKLPKRCPECGSRKFDRRIKY